MNRLECTQYVRHVESFRNVLCSFVRKVCADRTFYAHRIVLAAESEVDAIGIHWTFLRVEVFKSGLATVAKEAVDGRQEIRLAEISNPEAGPFHSLEFINKLIN